MQHTMEDMLKAVQALQRREFMDAYMEILECNHGNGDQGGLEEQFWFVHWVWMVVELKLKLLIFMEICMQNII